MSKIRIPELDIEVDDISHFNDEAGEILGSFCEDLEAKGMTIPIDEETMITREEGILYWWTSEATRLIREERKRLESIGVKYFGLTLELDISTHMFKEL